MGVARDRLHLVNCSVLDVCAGRLIDGCSVTMESGVIVDVGPSAAVAAQEAHFIDLGGLTVMPGLIDAHVHVCMTGEQSALDDYLTDPASTTLRKCLASLALSVACGVTTIRDVGCPTALGSHLRDLQARGLVMGPRIFTSGSVITTKGGHCHYFGVQTDGSAEIEKAVQSLLQGGADFVKVMVSGGSLTKGSRPHDCQLTLDELGCAVSTAHRLGKKVACHAHSTESIGMAIGCGADSVEHGSYATEEQVGMLADRNVALVPTLAPASRTLARLGSRVPRDLVERVNRRRDVARWAIREGATILAGTDAGIPFMPHGKVSEEIECLTEMGLSPAEAIQAATVNVARWMGRADELGQVRAGMVADLIAVKGNPLTDIRTLRTPLLVIQDGAVVFARSSEDGTDTQSMADD